MLRQNDLQQEDETFRLSVSADGRSENVIFVYLRLTQEVFAAYLMNFFLKIASTSYRLLIQNIATDLELAPKIQPL